MVRFTRLVIEAGHSTVSLALHRRLTVIAGVDEGVRTALIRELIGALGPKRDGVHLELEEDAGRRIAIFRPSNGPDRVADVSAGKDVTSTFATKSGAVDFLAAHGLDVSSATEAMYLGREALETAVAASDELVTRLAERDQTELWSSAARVRITAGQLDTMEAERQQTAAEREVEAKIEALHQDLEDATNQHAKLRKATLAIAALALLVAVPVARVDPILAIPVVAVGMITMIAAFAYRAHVVAAQRSEQEALADVGANSYLGFVVQRVDGMLSTSDELKQANDTLEDHRNALVYWSKLAGEVTMEWAVEHHDEIEVAAQVRREMASMAAGSTGPDDHGAQVSKTIERILTRAIALKRVGSSKQALPMILDDPFSALTSEERLAVVDFLSGMENFPQMVLLTAQDDVAEWARRSAPSGGLAIVEPQARPASTREDVAV